jgi:hypothetical protein
MVESRLIMAISLGTITEDYFSAKTKTQSSCGRKPEDEILGVIVFMEHFFLCRDSNCMKQHLLCRSILLQSCRRN